MERKFSVSMTSERLAEIKDELKEYKEDLTIPAFDTDMIDELIDEVEGFMSSKKEPDFSTAMLHVADKFGRSPRAVVLCKVCGREFSTSNNSIGICSVCY